MKPGTAQAPPGLGNDLLASCEEAGTVVWLFDLSEDRFLFVSPAYERLWGRPSDELGIRTRRAAREGGEISSERSVR